jgi:hypothetical protein
MKKRSYPQNSAFPGRHRSEIQCFLKSYPQSLTFATLIEMRDIWKYPLILTCLLFFSILNSSIEQDSHFM